MDGDADLLYCPDDQLFNKQTLQCEDASNVECNPIGKKYFKICIIFDTIL